MHTNIHYKTYKTKTVKKLALTAEYNLNLVQKVNCVLRERSTSGAGVVAGNSHWLGTKSQGERNISMDKTVNTQHKDSRYSINIRVVTWNYCSNPGGSIGLLWLWYLTEPLYQHQNARDTEDESQHCPDGSVRSSRIAHSRHFLLDCPFANSWILSTVLKFNENTSLPIWRLAFSAGDGSILQSLL